MMNFTTSASLTEIIPLIALRTNRHSLHPSVRFRQTDMAYSIWRETCLSGAGIGIVGTIGIVLMEQLILVAIGWVLAMAAW
jgi:hypothetical protein